MNNTIEVTNTEGYISIISYDKDNNKTIETTNGVVSDHTLPKQTNAKALNDYDILSKIEQVKQIPTTNYGEICLINKVLEILEKDQ